MNEILFLAVSKLVVCLINQDKLKELEEKTNSPNYLSLYSPDKVALANELFATLNKEGLTYQ